jgi:hypothetical protein
MRYILTALIFSISAIVNAQEKSSDKAWLDSLKRITQKDPLLFSEKKQSKWANAFIELAQYYEANHSLKKAIFYYEKLLDVQYDYINQYSSDDKLIANCNKFSRKLSNYYYEGKVIKKDIEKSYSYAFNGNTGNKKDYIRFSKRYFNSTALILKKVDTTGYKNDSIFVCTVNSFLQKPDVNIQGINDPLLDEIANRFIKQESDSIHFIQIVHYPPTCCMYDMCRGHYGLEKIKKYLTDNFRIAENKIITNIELGGGESYSYFNNFKTPVIEIKFTKTDEY